MKRLRMILDVAMTVLMPLLMAYSLIGETFHEIIGTLIFILFIIHHMLLAYWGYVLLSVHAGTHLTASLTKLRRNRRGAFTLLITALAAVSLYGAYAFVKRGFPEYLFAKTMFAFFDYSEPVLLFLLDYLAVMAACMMIGWILLSGLNRIRVGKKNQRS